MRVLSRRKPRRSMSATEFDTVSTTTHRGSTAQRPERIFPSGWSVVCSGVET